MSDQISEALRILETPEAEGGLQDYEKIAAVRDILRDGLASPASVVEYPLSALALAAQVVPVEVPAAPVVEEVSVVPVADVPAVAVAPIVDAPQPPVQ